MKARRLWLLGAFAPCFAFAQTTSVTVDANAPGRMVDERLFGANSTLWDSALGSSATQSLLQAAGLRAIRLPGGSLSDEYHWRTNTNLLNTFKWASGFNVSAALTANLNAHAMITVNYGTGTPEEAAAWVAYANFPTSGGTDVNIGADAPAPGTAALPTPGSFDWQTARAWANLRAASPLGADDGMNFLRIGRDQPFGFKYWEIGNENYGDWESDLQSPAHGALTYANRAAQYMTKMRAVDPTIKVGVVIVKSGEYNNWTQVALGQLNTLGVRPDFVIYHRYDGAPGQESDSALLQSANTWAADDANLRALVNAAFGANGPGIEIIVTENNSVYASPGKQSTNLVNGLFLADSVANVMTKTGINGFFWWDVRNGPSNTGNNLSAALYGWRNYGDYGLLSSVPGTTFTGAPTTFTETYPTYYAFKLLSIFARGGDIVLPATSSGNMISAFAVQRAGGGHSLLVINKNPTNAITVDFTLTGITATSATIYSFGKTNDDAAQPGASGCADLTSTTATVTAGTLSRSIPSYSMNVIWLGPNAPAAPMTMPAVSAQPAAASRTAGASATFTAAAAGCPQPNYHWQRAPSGSSTFTDVTDGGAYTGTTTGTLTVATTTAMSGDQFRLTATNGAGTVNSSAVTLTVTAAPSSSGGGAGGGSGGGGGGGRVDWPLLASLLACLAMRRRAAI